MANRLHAHAARVVVIAAMLGASASSGLMTGCKKSGGDLVALRDALASGDAAKVPREVERAPACAVDADAGGRATDECLGRVATWLGSKKGFQYDPPDQAGAATAAVLVAREHRGEALPAPEAWLYTMREGDGPGADALRLAVASRMVTELGPLARVLESEADARALMRAVSGSVPGACPTYALLGAGMDDGALPPEQRADHSPCVQKDLNRPTGPEEHGKYGSGAWRGAEGALALWRAAAAALHEGVKRPDADASAVKAVAAKLPEIDAALAKVVTKKLPPRVDWSAAMGDAHEDAGAPMVPAAPSAKAAAGAPGSSPRAPRP